MLFGPTENSFLFLCTYVYPDGEGEKQKPHDVFRREDVFTMWETNSYSFVFRFEFLPEINRPQLRLEKALHNVLGIPISIHLYVSAPGSKVLKPHTDPYDVLVFQLVGTKSWRACTPKPELATLKYNLRDDLNQAQLCMLKELDLGRIEGCNTYTVNDTVNLNCEDFTMSPGDVLYMPKGVVHYATTSPVSGGSFHMTVGIHRGNMQWFDVLLDVAESVDRTVDPFLIRYYSETPQGVHLHETVAGWLLACFGNRDELDPCDVPRCLHV